jgi:hypothetical protein
MKINHNNHGRTLKISFPIGYSIGLAILFLVCWCGLCEFFTRLESVQAALPAHSIGSANKKLEIKIAYLDQLVRDEGPVDFIFLGGSDVNNSIDPEIFKQKYKAVTGEEPSCFIFGVDRLIPPAAALMAEILVKKYRPKLIIWGLSPTSFSKKLSPRTKNIILANPWCRIHLGKFNFEGWLSEHSYAYRYFLKFRIWLERPDYFKSILKAESNTTKYGALRHPKKIKPLKLDPVRMTRFRRYLSSFKMSEDAVIALKQILNYNEQIEIILVEIPVHRSILSLYPEGKKDHNKISHFIAEQANAQGVLYIPTSQLELIPNNGWRNSNHMNIKGSRIFSEWLGEKLGKLARKGKI